MWYTQTTFSFNIYSDEFINYCKYVIYGLLFFDYRYMQKISMGSHYNSYFMKYYTKIYNMFNDKIYWMYFCNKYNLKHPKVIKILKNNKLNFKMNKNLISKPRFGCLGHDITQKINNENDYDIVIQKYIKDDKINGSRSYRLVTFFDGDILDFYEIHDEKSKLISNYGRWKSCKNLKCIPSNLKNKVKEIIDKLKIIHKNEYNFCYSLSWDFVINKKDIYLLECNLGGSLYTFYTKIINLNKCYEKFIKFKNLKSEYYNGLINLDYIYNDYNDWLNKLII